MGHHLQSYELRRTSKLLFFPDQRSRLINTRDLLHLAIAFQRIAGERLDALAGGAEPASAGEMESCWTILPLALDFERRMACEYRAASGLDGEYGE